MPTPDMTEVIEDSLTDAQLTDAPETDSEPAEPVEAADTSTEDAGPGSPATRTEDAATGADALSAFAKEHGLPPQVAGQRENRIPYSRSKAISENAVKKATEPLYKEIESYKTKVTEYEGYLQNVQRFEDVMQKNPIQFLQMLVKIPGYQEIFQQIAGQAPAQAESAAPAEDGMPEPDQQLSDGTAVYSMEGLRKRDAWVAQQVENRILDKVKKEYEPVKQAWETGTYRANKLREIQQQLDDARGSWPQFQENEAEIAKALAAYPQLSLEGAYRHVVFPKLKADRESMRKELMTEMKKAPAATAAPSKTTKPVAGGKRTMEQIINDSIDRLEAKQ